MSEGGDIERTHKMPWLRTLVIKPLSGEYRKRPKNMREKKSVHTDAKRRNSTLSRTEVERKSWRVSYLLVSHAEMEVCASHLEHHDSWPSCEDGGGAYLDDAEYDEGEE